MSERVTRHTSIGTYLPHTSVGTTPLHFMCHLIVTGGLRFINNYPKHLTGICIAELIISLWVRNCSPFKKSEIHCRLDRIPYFVTTLSQINLVLTFIGPCIILIVE